MTALTAPKSLKGTYDRMCRKDRECMRRCGRELKRRRWRHHLMRSSDWHIKSIAFKDKWNAKLSNQPLA